ncbi:amino acid ABC transporter substrate-binding protein [Candidatus Synechococcus spongiarum LMB bulk10D]|nr:amino acid ABC transporter substrate-binding protein [Candidatus Synechococcus spongiarum LMB bulk10D]
MQPVWAAKDKKDAKSKAAQEMTTSQGSTLEAVKKNGHVKCGVSKGLAGFSNPDAKNNWSGLDVDFCRALAAAIFNDPSKVTFTPTSAKERFTALQSGEVDLLSRNTTWTISRDTSLGFDFVGVLYYDGQGFMVNNKLKVKSAKELNGATVCVQTGTTTELNLADYFKSNGMKYKLVAFENDDEVVKAYDAGRCDVLTTDQSGLYAVRTKLKKPEDHVVLPDVIAKEPLGPLVRHGDHGWADLARWTFNALVEAEELGITQGNVDMMKKSAKSPLVRRFLGLDDNLGGKLGLSKEWAYQVVKHLGNYGELFEKNLGAKTPLKMARGLNALWTDGGMQYALPMR